MTGPPTEKNDSQNDDRKTKAWDERTRALAARLQALLEQDRAQGRDAEDRDRQPPAPTRRR